MVREHHSVNFDKYWFMPVTLHSFSVQRFAFSKHVYNTIIFIQTFFLKIKKFNIDNFNIILSNQEKPGNFFWGKTNFHLEILIPKKVTKNKNKTKQVTLRYASLFPWQHSTKRHVLCLIIPEIPLILLDCISFRRWQLLKRINKNNLHRSIVSRHRHQKSFSSTGTHHTTLTDHLMDEATTTCLLFHRPCLD